MSKRWFILVLSLVFLFIFRAWIDDVSTPERYRVGIIDAGGNNQLLIYPASSHSAPYEISGINTLDALRKTDESRYIEFLESHNELLYIFPIFPDTLGYTINDVIVNHDIGPYPYHSLRLTDF